jgi:hypothetical protein
MPIAPIAFPQQQAYSDASNLFKSLQALGQQNQGQGGLANLAAKYGPANTGMPGNPYAGPVAPTANQTPAYAGVPGNPYFGPVAR